MSTSSANDEQATAPGTTARFPRGLSSRWADWLTAGSVVLVVVLVSVPMLHGVARRENEHDAHTTPRSARHGRATVSLTAVAS